MISEGKIPAAIIGLGRIASLLEDDKLREKPCTHAGALAANPDCFIAAGADTDEERRSLFAGRWDVPVYADAAEMIDAHAPKILVIATHPDSHGKYCALAAARKVPLVICEKPLADTLRGARRIAALHRQGKITVLVNHERRYSGDYRKARALLDEGRLGPLLGVRALLYMGKKRRLLDVLWHDGTHLADAVMFLSGRRLIHRRSFGASLRRHEGTAWLEGRLDHDSVLGPPVPFIMELGAGRDHLAFEIEFSCEKGRLRIGNGLFEVWESAPSPYAEGFRSLQNTAEAFDGPTGYFANMAADAVACVQNPSKTPQSSALDGLRVIEYLHHVDRWK
ncbi:oxidoreductase [Spirochaetia bacterium]|nr:oxidoreductase [Spirochaetia bacterium]